MIQLFEPTVICIAFRRLVIEKLEHKAKAKMRIISTLVLEKIFFKLPQTAKPNLLGQDSM